MIATQPTTPTIIPEHYANAPSLSNTQSLAEKTEHSNAAAVKSPEAARFLPGDRNSNIHKGKIVLGETTEQTSATGSTSAMAQRDADGDKNADISSSIEFSEPARETSHSTLLERARPAISATRLETGAAAKAPVNENAGLGSTKRGSLSSAALSQSVISSVDRSCDVVSHTEPARLYLERATSDSDKGVTGLRRNELSQRPTAQGNDSLASPSRAANNRDSSAKSSSDRLGLPDSSYVSLYFFKNPASSASSVSPKSEVSFVTAVKPVQPATIQTSRIENESSRTTASPYLDSTAKQQNGELTNTGRLYRPRSMENLLEPSCSWKTQRTSRTLQDSAAEASPACRSSGSTGGPFTKPSGDGRVLGNRQPEAGKMHRPKSSCDLLSAVSHSPETDSSKCGQNGAKFFHEPTVKGLLENLRKTRERQLQEPITKDTAPTTAAVCSPTAVCRGSEKLPRAAAAGKHSETSPVITHSVDLQSTAPPQKNWRSGQFEDVFLLSPRDQDRCGTNSDGGGEPGKKKYLTKWQAEIQRKEQTRLGQLNGRRPGYDAPSDAVAQKSLVSGPPPPPPPISVASTRGLSNKFSKSVDDLSATTGRTVEIGDGEREESLTEWQLEVQRRKAARDGRYVDPEKLPRSKRHGALSKSKNIHKSMVELNNEFAADSEDRKETVTSHRPKRKSNLYVSVENLATCHLADDTQWSYFQPGRASLQLSGVQTRTNAAASGYDDRRNSVAENDYESIDDLPIAERGYAYQVCAILKFF